MTSNEKNNDTFTSSTLKVEEVKVVLFFLFGQKLTSYGKFVIFGDFYYLTLNSKL